MLSSYDERGYEPRTEVDLQSTTNEAGLITARRERATEREYRRRQGLDRAFNALAARVPPRFFSKGTKFEVLCGAISYIEELVDFIVLHQMSIYLIQEWKPADQEEAPHTELHDYVNQRFVKSRED